MVYRWPAAERLLPLGSLLFASSIATLDLSEWLPNRTQQVGRMAKGPSNMFFDACAGTIAQAPPPIRTHVFGQAAGALVALVTGAVRDGMN